MSVNQRLACGLTLVAALVAAPVIADCGDDANNLFQLDNCDFDAGITNWNASTGSIVWEMTDGDPMMGSLEGMLDGSGELVVTGPCVPAQASTSYGSGGRGRVITGSVNRCFIDVRQFSNGTCSMGHAPGARAEFLPPGGAWTNGHDDWTTDSGTGSIQLRIECRSLGGNEVVRFDNLYTGIGLTIPVELTDFSVE